MLSGCAIAAAATAGWLLRIELSGMPAVARRRRAVSGQRRRAVSGGGAARRPRLEAAGLLSAPQGRCPGVPARPAHLRAGAGCSRGSVGAAAEVCASQGRARACRLMDGAVLVNGRRRRWRPHMRAAQRGWRGQRWRPGAARWAWLGHGCCRHASVCREGAVLQSGSGGRERMRERRGTPNRRNRRRRRCAAPHCCGSCGRHARPPRICAHLPQRLSAQERQGARRSELGLSQRAARSPAPGIASSASPRRRRLADSRAQRVNSRQRPAGESSPPSSRPASCCRRLCTARQADQRRQASGQLQALHPPTRRCRLPLSPLQARATRRCQPWRRPEAAPTRPAR